MPFLEEFFYGKKELTYTQVGDYRYPDLMLPECPYDYPLGKYGLLHKSYLKEYRPMEYDRLLLAGQLDKTLYEIDAEAREMVERLIAEMAQVTGVDEHLEATDQMRWVGLMNNLQATAEEQVLREIVYGKPPEKQTGRRGKQATP